MTDKGLPIKAYRDDIHIVQLRYKAYFMNHITIAIITIASIDTQTNKHTHTQEQTNTLPRAYTHTHTHISTQLKPLTRHVIGVFRGSLHLMNNRVFP